MIYKECDIESTYEEDEEQSQTLSLLLSEYNQLKSNDIIQAMDFYNEKMKLRTNINYNIKTWLFYLLHLLIIGFFVTWGESGFWEIFCIIGIIPYIIYLVYEKIKIDKTKEEQNIALRNYEQILQKYGISTPNEYITRFEDLKNNMCDFYKKLISNMGFTEEDKYWLKEEKGTSKMITLSLQHNILKIYSKNDFLIKYKIETRQDLQKEDFKIDKIMEIDLSDILYFTKIGKEEHLSKISGGGGEIGGSNLTGAVLGGIIAGSTGAIIGSRKETKINSIETSTYTIDTRATLLKLKDKEILFNMDTYEALLKLIPSKDYESQIISKKNNNSEAVDNIDIVDKLEKLKSLLDTGVLTNEEFESQKKKILLIS